MAKKTGKQKTVKKAGTTDKQTVGKQRHKAKSRVARAAGVKDSHDRNDLWK
jgi:hypothetical protein